MFVFYGCLVGCRVAIGEVFQGNLMDGAMQRRKNEIFEVGIEKQVYLAWEEVELI